MKVRQKEIGRPLLIAAAVAVISAVVFLAVEFGPWNRVAAEPPDRAATEAAAQAAGAKVIPTQAVEPNPPGPKPVEPPVVAN